MPSAYPNPLSAVRSRAMATLVLAALTTITAFGTATLFPEQRPTVVAAYLLVLAALGIWLATYAITVPYTVANDETFQRALAPPVVPPYQPEELLSFLRLIRFAEMSSVDLHYRLRPLLRVVAALRLATRHNVQLDSQPDQASALLGPVAWELLRADRSPPHDRHGRGIDRAALETVVAALEGI